MDTIGETEREHDDPMRFTSAACPAQYEGSGLELFFPLSPALLIGLNAQPGKAAEVAGSLVVRGVMLEGVLLARLEVFDPLVPRGLTIPYDDGTAELLLAQVLQPGRIDFAMEVPVPAAMDHLPPGNHNLGFSLALCPTGPENSQAALGFANLDVSVAHGAALDLPLDEFHDVIPLATEGGLVLSTPQTQRRVVPGGVALWDIEVKGATSSLFTEVFGVSKELATLHSSNGESVVVSLAVPAEARDGDVFEIVVNVGVPSSGATSAIRLTAIADPVNGDDDTSKVQALAGGAHATPGMPAAFVVATLLVVVLRRLRRKSGDV